VLLVASAAKSSVASVLFVTLVATTVASPKVAPNPFTLATSLRSIIVDLLPVPSLSSVATFASEATT
jgi:hypothetical protein